MKLEKCLLTLDFSKEPKVLVDDVKKIFSAKFHTAKNLKEE